MPDPRIEKLADVLVNYSVAIQPGDRVFVFTEKEAVKKLEKLISVSLNFF